MIFRNIQGSEIMEVVLNLRTIMDGKTGAAKNRLDALQGSGSRATPLQ